MIIHYLASRIFSKAAILFVFSSHPYIGSAQYTRIPNRLCRCIDYKRTDHKLFLDGTGINKNEKEKDSVSRINYACVQSYIKDREELFIPLWYNLKLCEDIYFIGDAEIDNFYVTKNQKVEKTYSFIISDHKIIRRGNIKNQNLRYTSVEYNKGSYVARTERMIGMRDYEDLYEVRTHLHKIDSITVIKIPEPRILKHLHKYEETISNSGAHYKAQYEDDCTF